MKVLDIASCNILGKNITMTALLVTLCIEYRHLTEINVKIRKSTLTDRTTASDCKFHLRPLEGTRRNIIQNFCYNLYSLVNLGFLWKLIQPTILTTSTRILCITKKLRKFSSEKSYVCKVKPFVAADVVSTA